MLHYLPHLANSPYFSSFSLPATRFLVVGAAKARPAVLRPGPTQSRPVTVSFGAALGANYSNMNFNEGSPKPLIPVPTSWKLGYTLGFWVRLAGQGKVAVQQEYLFAQLSGEVDGGPHYTLRYLSLPLLLRYELLPGVALVAGPQVDLLIDAQSTVAGQSSSITHDTEERGIGATAGAEIRIVQNLRLNVRYLQGLNHIGIGQRSAVQEFKFQSLQTSLAFRF